MDLLSGIKTLGQLYNQANSFGGLVVNSVVENAPKVGKYLEDQYKGVKGHILVDERNPDSVNKLPKDVQWQAKGTRSRLPTDGDETRMAFNNGGIEALKLINNLQNTDERLFNNIGNFAASKVNSATGLNIPVPEYKPIFAHRDDDKNNQYLDNLKNKLNKEIIDKKKKSGKDTKVSEMVSSDMGNVYQQYMDAKEAKAIADEVEALRKQGVDPDEIVKRIESMNNATQAGRALIDTASDPLQYIPGMTIGDSLVDLTKLGIGTAKMVGKGVKGAYSGGKAIGKVVGNLAEGVQKQQALKGILKDRPGLKGALTGGNTLENSRLAQNLADYGSQLPVGVKGSQLEFLPSKNPGQLVSPQDLTLKGTKKDLPSAKFGADPEILGKEYVDIISTPINSRSKAQVSRLKELESLFKPKIEEPPIGLVDESGLIKPDVPQESLPNQVDLPALQQTGELLPPTQTNLKNSKVNLPSKSFSYDPEVLGKEYAEIASTPKNARSKAQVERLRELEALYKPKIDEVPTELLDTSVNPNTLNQIEDLGNQLSPESIDLYKPPTLDDILAQTLGDNHGFTNQIHLPGAGTVELENSFQGALYNFGHNIKKMVSFNPATRTREVNPKWKNIYQEWVGDYISPMAKALGMPEEELVDQALHTYNSINKYGVEEVGGKLVPKKSASDYGRGTDLGNPKVSMKTGVWDETKGFPLTEDVLVELLTKSGKSPEEITRLLGPEIISKPLNKLTPSEKKKLFGLVKDSKKELVNWEADLKPKYNLNNLAETLTELKTQSPVDEKWLSNNAYMRIPENKLRSGSSINFQSVDGGTVPSAIVAMSDGEQGIYRASTGLHEGSHQMLDNLAKDNPDLPRMVAKDFFSKLDVAEREAYKDLALRVVSNPEYASLKPEQILDEILAYFNEANTIQNVPHQLIDSVKTSLKKSPSLGKKLEGLSQRIFTMSENQDAKLFKTYKQNPELKESVDTLKYVMDNYHGDFRPIPIKTPSVDVVENYLKSHFTSTPKSK